MILIFLILQGEKAVYNPFYLFLRFVFARAIGLWYPGKNAGPGGQAACW